MRASVRARCGTQLFLTLFFRPGCLRTDHTAQCQQQMDEPVWDGIDRLQKRDTGRRRVRGRIMATVMATTLRMLSSHIATAPEKPQNELSFNQRGQTRTATVTSWETEVGNAEVSTVQFQFPIFYVLARVVFSLSATTQRRVVIRTA